MNEARIDSADEWGQFGDDEDVCNYIDAHQAAVEALQRITDAIDNDETPAVVDEATLITADAAAEAVFGGYDAPLSPATFAGVDGARVFGTVAVDFSGVLAFDGPALVITRPRYVQSDLALASACLDDNGYGSDLSWLGPDDMDGPVDVYEVAASWGRQ